MQTLKDEALSVISKLPNESTIDDLMYELYVIEKIRKAEEAIERGETITSEQLKKEIEQW